MKSSPIKSLVQFVRVTAFGSVLTLFVLCLAFAERAGCQYATLPASPAPSAEASNSTGEIYASGKGLHSEALAITEALVAPGMNASFASEEVHGAAKQTKAPVESEVIFEGLASYGHYKIFASGSDCKLYTAGVEYDRHSWGQFLGARVDYVAEFLPVVLLDAPLTQDIWGTPTSPYRHIVPGIGIAPIGFRMLWRDHKRIMPYMEAKGGMLGFTQKAISQEATYEDFSLQSGMGVKLRMKQRWDLRLGLFSDFHFSNGFIVPVDPGLDVMNANLGLVYHLGAGRP